VLSRRPQWRELIQEQIHISAEAADADEPDLVFIDAILSVPSLLDGGYARVLHHGSGASLTVEEAVVPAVAEALERYAAGSVDPKKLVMASANSLSERVLDLDTIARCSAMEQLNPLCPLNIASKMEPIRWMKGISLLDGGPSMVPAIMAYSPIGWHSRQEQFWLPISTGCAAQTTYEGAILSGLCEVFERDAIALTWLQQLELPRIEMDMFGPELRAYWDCCQETSGDVQYHFFDARTNMGVPTVYALQVSTHHPFARTIVACATALDYQSCLIKVIRDLTIFKRAFRRKRLLPEDTYRFTHLLDGAAYMALPEHAHAFNFLLNTKQKTKLSDLILMKNNVTLRHMIQHLSNLKMQAIAVDLTTEDVRSTGLSVVRVIVPELQPLSLSRAAQYRGSDRLYSAPGKMGYGTRNEKELNEWPQPFA
jgi:ribosomal protein S12 methylthiotransferase accessory factor